MQLHCTNDAFTPIRLATSSPDDAALAMQKSLLAFAPGPFAGRYANRIVTGGIGHNLPQEAPQAFAEAVIDARRV